MMVRDERFGTTTMYQGRKYLIGRYDTKGEWYYLTSFEELPSDLKHLRKITALKKDIAC